ncbi:hypothetical protein WG66_004766 [Moniliophthora roreri]|nr:hypothetical protein WG66_004766 [Moniliophthora roreri]
MNGLRIWAPVPTRCTSLLCRACVRLEGTEEPDLHGVSNSMNGDRDQGTPGDSELTTISSNKQSAKTRTQRR